MNDIYQQPKLHPSATGTFCDILHINKQTDNQIHADIKRKT